MCFSLTRAKSQVHFLPGCYRPYSLILVVTFIKCNEISAMHFIKALTLSLSIDDVLDLCVLDNRRSFEHVFKEGRALAPR